MILTRTGHKHNCGTFTLIDKNIQSMDKCDGLRWIANPGYLQMQVTCVNGKSTYDYELRLEVDEILRIFEIALFDQAETKTEKNQAKAITGFIQQVLMPDMESSAVTNSQPER